jgi:acetyltransferase
MPALTLAHDQAQASALIQRCLTEGRTYLGELEGLELLRFYGFQTLPTQLAISEGAAADIAEAMGFPVVMKIVSDQIIHKSDAGGVVVGLQNREETEAAYRRITANASQYNPQAFIRGVLVQKMAPKGEEVIIGMNRYGVGPLLMFGLGGIFVEVFRDVVFRLAPIDRNEAHVMIREIRGWQLLQGFRGRPQADTDTLERLMACLSDLVVNHPEIIEMDINPLLVHPQGQGATVADCRIILNPD